MESPSIIIEENIPLPPKGRVISTTGALCEQLRNIKHGNSFRLRADQTNLIKRASFYSNIGITIHPIGKIDGVDMIRVWRNDGEIAEQQGTLEV